MLTWMIEAADTDDIAGISQSTVQRPDRKLPHMDRHIQHGDFNKARQALVGAAVVNVGTASVRERLRSKYPPPEHPRQPFSGSGSCINDSDSLLAQIMAKKRGASMSTCTLPRHSSTGPCTYSAHTSTL